MVAATKQVDIKILQDLIPLNELSAEAFSELAKKIVIEEVRAKRYLFRKGDRDNQSVYLLAGRLNLLDGRRAVVSELEGRTDACRLPLDNRMPRSLSARAITKVLVARVDSGLLEAFLAGNSVNSTEVKEIKADDNEDWMTHILQSEAVKKIPPSNIQQLLMKMEPFEVQAGEVIFSQGDEGTHFYTIHRGRCAITCSDSPDGEEKLICELDASHSFGEEALILETRRNATVSMLTDGLLVQLPKEDFIELMQRPLVRFLPYDKAEAMVAEDAVWVDVRESEDYESGAIEDSVNIPLYSLRSEVSELVFNARYIICCENGQRSVSAAFILSHRGFDVYVLEGGLEAAAASAAANDQEVTALEQEDIAPAHKDTALDQEDTALEQEVMSSAGASDGDDEQTEAVHADLEALRNINSRLVTEVDQRGKTELRLTEQLEQSRSELGEANELMAELYSRAQVDADEKQSLQDQLAALLEESKAQTSALAQELQQSQGAVGAEQDKQQAQIEQLQAELAQAREELAAGSAAAAAATQELEALHQNTGTAQQEQQVQLGQLQAELAQAREELAAGAAAAAAATQELEALHQNTGTAQQQQQVQLGQLQAELAQAREELAAGAAAATQELAGLHQDAGTAQQEQQAQIEQLQAELAQAREELAAGAAAATQELAALHQDAGTAQQEQQAQIEQLQAELAQAREELTAGAAAAAAATQELEALHQDAGTAQQEQQAQIGQLQAELAQAREELANVMQERHATASETQAALTEAQEQVQELTVALQRETHRVGELESGNAGLEQQHAALAAELAGIEEKRHALEAVTAAEQQVRQQEQEQLVAAVAERDNAQLQVDRLEQENSRLQDEFGRLETQLKEQEKTRTADSLAAREELESRQGAWEIQRASLEEQLAALAGNADDQTRALQSRITELEQLGSGKDSELQALQAQMAARDSAAQQLGEEVERLRASQAEKLQDAAETDARLQALEKDYQAAIHKANADLEARVASEQDLLGQVERLRKQLEHASSESQQVQNSVQGDIGQLREELAAERKARDEERVEMGARQKQLKQQLATVAAEHEDNLSRHDALVKSACDSARQEERARLLQEMEAQKQPDTDVRQLESRIEELEQERDSAQQDQLATLEKLRHLQAELEAASAGAGAGQETAKTIAALQAELEESQQNLEIAERLRGEAEAAREQIAAQHEQLLAEPEMEMVLEEVILPSLDDDLASGSDPEPAAVALPENAVTAATDPEPAGKGFKFVVDSGVGRFNLLGWGLGLAVAGVVAAGVFWASTQLQAPLAESREVARPDTPVPDATPDTSAPVQTASEDAAPAGNTVLLTVVAGRTFRDSLKDGGRGPLMVELPAASFPMGSVGNSLNFDEGPRHYVTLARFSIGKHEVTFAEYERFARATGRRLPYDEGWGRGDRPVINVSWKDANAYADWLSAQTGRTYRLPTEAQWEFAARAGTTGNYWWDRDDDAVHANCFSCGSEWDGERTAPAGNFAANAFGIHDTAGNVQEWAQDCYRAGYRDASADGAAWLTPECTQRVVRGGSYSSPKDSLRNAKRSQYDQDTRLDNLGFRIVRLD